MKITDEAVEAALDSACLSYRHDFGLLPEQDRETLRRTAKWWLEAWQKALPHLSQGAGEKEGEPPTDAEAKARLAEIVAKNPEDFGPGTNPLGDTSAAPPHMGGVTDQECDHICMGECATEGCENCGIHHFEVGGVGSYYCGSCLKKIAALASHEPAPEPAKDGPEVVERLRKWCSETINQWSDEYEPRENWERQVSGAMREWDKATTEIISDYEALRAELIKSRNYWSEQCSDLNQRNAELVKALEEIASDDERGDYEGVVQFARAALGGQSNE